MHLDTYEQVSEAAKLGRKVVCRVSSGMERQEVAAEIIRKTKDDWHYSKSKPEILRLGEGFLHMVITPEEVRGMEYHDSIGWIGEEVAARVRLNTHIHSEERP